MNTRSILKRVAVRMVTLIILLPSLGSSFAGLSVATQARSVTTEVAQTAPTNDNFISAQILPGFAGTATGTTTGASKEALEPPHAKNRGGASIWFKYVATGNSVLTVSTSGSDFDTTLAVYKGTAVNNVKLIAENDDSPPSFTSSVNVATQNGDVLYIAVDGYFNLSTGFTASGNVQLAYSVTNVVGNDNFANAKLLSFNEGKFITTSNVGASKESGEPAINFNSGGKSVWFKWVAPANCPKSITFTIESRNAAGTGPVKTLAGIYTGVQVNNLNQIVSGSRTGPLELPFLPVANATYYLAIDGVDGGAGADTGSFTISYGPSKLSQGADFDRDGRSDLTVFRPSTGAWYSLDSITDQLRSVQFGVNGDKPLLADLGRDGKLDYTIFRPDTGTWYVLDSESGFKAFAWGLSGDIPLIQHFALDYYNTLAVFRPTTGWWWTISYPDQFAHDFPYGANGDIPMTADFDGRGRDQTVVFRPSNGTWYRLNTSVEEPSVKFGTAGDRPVPADYDGDGVDDFAVFRPSTGVWYIQNSSDSSVIGVQWGVSGDIPQPADYDGDGRADIAVFRNGVWYIRQGSPATLRAVQFGLPGDIPVTTPIH